MWNSEEVNRHNFQKTWEWFCSKSCTLGLKISENFTPISASGFKDWGGCELWAKNVLRSADAAQIILRAADKWQRANVHPDVTGLGARAKKMGVLRCTCTQDAQPSSFTGNGLFPCMPIPTQACGFEQQLAVYFWTWGHEKTLKFELSGMPSCLNLSNISEGNSKTTLKLKFEQHFGGKIPKGRQALNT